MLGTWNKPNVISFIYIMLNDHSLVLDVNGPRSGIGSRAFKGDIPGLRDSQSGNACSLDSLKIFHFSLVP